MARRGDSIFLRGRTWWLDFTHQGQRHVSRLGRNISRTVAREIGSVKRGEILKGEPGIGPRKRKDPTFEHARDEFLRWVSTNKKPRTRQGYGECLAALGKVFAGRRLSAIDEPGIERHKRRLVEAGHPTTANRQLAVLRAMFNRCRDLALYEGATPRIKLLKEPKGRLRFLDSEEEGRLLEAAGEPLRTIVLVGIHTGLRLRSEILTLQKADVDLARGLVTVQAAYAKSGRTRTVPLNSTVRAALARHVERTPGAHVFAKADGTRLGSARKAFELACARAKLAGVTPHVLRHTFASKLAMAGVDPRTIQELGGWATLGMVERYAHLSPAHRLEAVERIAGNSTALVTAPPHPVVAVAR